MAIDKLNKYIPPGVPVTEFDNESKIKEGVSIIISAYNNDNYIEECLDSVQNQTYFKDNENYEILVGIDGCLKTLKKLKEIKDKYKNLKVYNFEKNKGMYVTSNALIFNSKYDKLITFGSDDNMKPDMVSQIIEISKRADAIRFKFDVFGNKSSEILNMAGSYYAYGAAFFKRNVFEIYGGYDNTRFSGDFELFTRLKKFIRVGFLDSKVFNYRYHSSNLSNTVDRSERNLYDKKIKETTYTPLNNKTNTVLNIGKKL